MAIKAVFFDIGGTLVDSTSILKKNMWDVNKKYLKTLGHEFTEKEIKEAQQKTNKIIIEKYGNPDKNGVFFTKIMYEILGVEIDEKTAQRLDIQFWNEIDSQLSLIKNAVEILDYLKNNGYKLVAVTNNKTERAKKVLETFNLIGFFDDIITSEEFGLKSTIVPFKVALDRFGLNADEVVMVGNNIFEDVAAAKQICIKTILVHFEDNLDEFYKTYTEVEDGVKADYVINNLIDIKSIVEELNSKGD